MSLDFPSTESRRKWERGVDQRHIYIKASLSYVIDISSELLTLHFYSYYAVLGHLDNVQLTSAELGGAGPKADWVEYCEADNYINPDTSACAPGFTRDPPNGGEYAPCVACNCNGHSNVCHPETGLFTLFTICTFVIHVLPRPMRRSTWATGNFWVHSPCEGICKTMVKSHKKNLCWPGTPLHSSHLTFLWYIIPNSRFFLSRKSFNIIFIVNSTSDGLTDVASV